MTAALLSLGLLFVVSFLAPTVNFILPIRPTWLLFLLPVHINWLIVAAVGTVASALGALPLYWTTKKVKDRRTVKKWLAYRWVQWFVVRFKDKPFLLIIFLILTPVPDQLLGILGALENYSAKKFIWANIVGRVLFYFPIALAGYLFRGNINDVTDWFLRLIGI